jgi:ribonuclease HI
MLAEPPTHHSFPRFQRVLSTSSHNTQHTSDTMVYGKDFEEIHRLYDPSEDRCLYGLPRNQFVAYDTAKHTSGVSQLRMNIQGRPELNVRHETLVVHIDGACRGNGTPDARATWGVYFGPGSPFNANGKLPTSMPQTSTRAEIEALSQALDIICQITDKDYALSQIKIATDSSFLVKAMSEWIEEWIENDGVGSRGKRVAHYLVFKQLHEKLDYMEYSDAGGIEVQFWHVGREMNREADALANKAFA